MVCDAESVCGIELVCAGRDGDLIERVSWWHETGREV